MRNLGKLLGPLHDLLISFSFILNINQVLFRPIAVKVNQTNVRCLVTTPTTNIQAQVIQVRIQINFMQV